jgi:small-conductance mechanosensitive channel
MNMDMLSDLVKEGPVTKLLIVLLGVLFGYLLGNVASRALGRALSRALAQHQIGVARRLVFYGVFVLCVLTGLDEAGINLSVLVGAAGIASVAIGFASQTTMSNLISGLFMLLERPFTIGDVIKIGSTTGEVSSLGLLSTILRTPENTMVRIPNETLMKSEIVNTTRFAHRRVELLIGISYAADIGSVRMLVMNVLNGLELTRKEPAPMVHFKSFGDNAVLLGAEFWVERERLLEAQNTAADAVKKALEQAKIELPFPQRTLSFQPNQTVRVEVAKT